MENKKTGNNVQENQKPIVETPITQQDKLEKIRKIMEANDTPMLTTISGSKLISRPVKLQEAEFDGTLWFVTTKDSAKFDDIKKDARVNVAFGDKDYLSVSGTAEVVDDLPYKKRLWNGWLGKFFDMEYDNPNLVLIKVNAESAEYWEKVGLMKNLLTGIKTIGGAEKPPEEESHAKVELT